MFKKCFEIHQWYFTDIDEKNKPHGKKRLSFHFPNFFGSIGDREFWFRLFGYGIYFYYGKKSTAIFSIRNNISSRFKILTKDKF